MEATRNRSVAKRKGGIRALDRPSLMTATLVPNKTPDVTVAGSPVFCDMEPRGFVDWIYVARGFS